MSASASDSNDRPGVKTRTYSFGAKFNKDSIREQLPGKDDDIYQVFTFECGAVHVKCNASDIIEERHKYMEGLTCPSPVGRHNSSNGYETFHERYEDTKDGAAATAYDWIRAGLNKEGDKVVFVTNESKTWIRHSDLLRVQADAGLGV